MKLTTIVFAASLILAVQPASAQNLYNVTDNSISDWGVTFDSTGWKIDYLNTHLPTGKNDVDYVTEDNADKESGLNTYVVPGYSRNNIYDAEALYFDNDQNYGYVALVTGLSPNEDPIKGYPAGDIFLDTGVYKLGNLCPTYRYEYAIDITEKKLYRLLDDPTHSAWTNVTYTQHKEANPWQATHNGQRQYLADVDLAYSTIPEQTHYILETRFPLDKLGLLTNPGDPSKDIWLHWTMKCGNDYLNLKGDVNAYPVPEPSSLSLLLAGLGSLFGFKQARRKT